MMKKYVMPETVNVNIKESNLLEIVCASLPGNPEGFDENMKMAPKVKTV